MQVSKVRDLALIAVYSVRTETLLLNNCLNVVCIMYISACEVSFENGSHRRANRMRTCPACVAATVAVATSFRRSTTLPSRECLTLSLVRSALFFVDVAVRVHVSCEFDRVRCIRVFWNKLPIQAEFMMLTLVSARVLAMCAFSLTCTRQR